MWTHLSSLEFWKSERSPGPTWRLAASVYEYHCLAVEEEETNDKPVTPLLCSELTSKCSYYPQGTIWSFPIITTENSSHGENGGSIKWQDVTASHSSWTPALLKVSFSLGIAHKYPSVSQAGNGNPSGVWGRGHRGHHWQQCDITSYRVSVTSYRGLTQLLNFPWKWHHTVD